MARSRAALALSATAALLYTARSAALHVADLVGPHSTAPDVDCAMRLLAYEYGQHLGSQPGSASAMAAPFDTLFDALRLAEDCNASLTRSEGASSRFGGAASVAAASAPSAATYYADALHGSDSNPGTLSAPFATIGRALNASRSGPSPASIVLRGGTFHLSATLQLWPQDSGLSIAAYPGEQAVISGGVLLDPLQWVPDPVPTPSLTPPQQGSLLAWQGGGCVDAPGATNQGVCAPLGSSVASADACAALCAASNNCTGYTWHDSSCGEWAGWCYARLDGFDSCDGEGGHWSGWKLPPATAFTATLPAALQLDPQAFDQLFVGGVRAVRARWPNANPEVDISPTGFTSAASWLPSGSYPPPTETSDNGVRSYDPFFPNFQWGTGGTVANFTSGSFWGTVNPPAGAQYRVPGGLVLPRGAPSNGSDWDTSAAVVHAFHGGLWGDWAFTVAGPVDSSGALRFGTGGWQEARGSGAGAGWYIEGVPQLLDAAGEWIYSPSNRTLRMVFNGTASTANTTGPFVAAQLAQLISLAGNATSPVQGVTLGPGLTFAHTRTDALLPYTVPSGGDWSFHAGGAVSMVGTEDVTIVGCTFTRVGGNALFIGGYARGATVEGNEFSYTGASAIVTAGSGGWNMTTTAASGSYPEGTVISGNLARELGIYIKQSGFLYSALSANSSVLGNVVFNVPRAGININDGFGGGHLIAGNLMTNTVRETADHGCINSWDRQPYGWRTWNSSDTAPARTRITNNMLINNFHSVWPIDHDDGSNGYDDASNVLLWGGSKNYLGFDKHSTGNLYVYPDYSPAAAAMAAAEGEGAPLGNGAGVCAMSAGASAFPPSLIDTWTGNTCIVSSSGSLFHFYSCDPSSPTNGLIPILAANDYATGDGAWALPCGSDSWTLAQAQAAGIEEGSQLVPVPSTDQLVAAARALLGLDR